MPEPIAAAVRAKAGGPRHVAAYVTSVLARDVGMAYVPPRPGPKPKAKPPTPPPKVKRKRSAS